MLIYSRGIALDLRLLAVVFAILATGPRGDAVAADPVAGAPAHNGPTVEYAATGPQPVVAPIYDAFDVNRAMALVRFADRFYREPGNEGFEATIDKILEELRSMGFGVDPQLELEVIETDMRGKAWTPVSAQLSAVVDGKVGETLLQFDAKNDRHRTMLPTNSVSGTARGPVCFQLADVSKGSVLVTDQPMGFMLRRAQSQGAVAVLCSRLQKFNVDPTGKDRHLDAILYSKVSSRTTILTGNISPRTYQAIRSLAADPTFQVEFVANSKLTDSKLRTIVATFVGAELPDEVVPIACHVQEPGAVDNASGLGGFVEGARSLVSAIKAKTIARPRRSISIIWGNEMQQSRIFLEHTKRKPIVAFSADMIGASKEKTGAIALLERDPDPGAMVTLPPDEHTPWGAGKVTAERIRPNGLSLITRCALLDVARHVGGWETAEHPWEGGSDHDIFLRSKVPAVLVWHFTDFAYHTSLDRVDHVDPEAIRRVCTALLSAAYAVASPRPEDLPRYLASVKRDRSLRVTAAENAERGANALQWKAWFDGAESWLKELCGSSR